MNADWHATHPMPKNAGDAQRWAWHLAHAEACACRPIPARLREKMQAVATSPVTKGHDQGRK